MAKSTAVQNTRAEEQALTNPSDEWMQGDAGAGTSQAADDNIVPLVYILQAQSPQVNKRGMEFIEGAEAGSIWLRNARDPIVAGDEGIVFQPCHFHKDWVEWVPRASGGGFVGRYDNRPADAVEKPDPENPRRVRFVRPSGNECVRVRYHAGFVITPDGKALPYVIPMTGSGHTVSRQWSVMINANTFPNGAVHPAWAHYYRLKTKQRENAAGTWFTWDIQQYQDLTKDDAEAYARGKRLFDAFRSGEQSAAAPAEETRETSSTDDSAEM